MPVATQPGRHHLAHLLRRVERVDAAGLAVGPAAVAPDVVGTGEGDVAGGVLAAQRGGVAVRHRERRTGAARRDRDGTLPVAGAGALGDVLLVGEVLAAVRVDVHGLERGVAVVAAAHLGLPGQVRGPALPHDQARGLARPHLVDLLAGHGRWPALEDARGGRREPYLGWSAPPRC